MSEKKFTSELKDVLTYIQKDLIKEFKSDVISTEYFILSILDNTSSVAYKILSKLMLKDSIDDTKKFYQEWVFANTFKSDASIKYDDIFETSIQQSKKLATQQKSKMIHSGHVLYCILSNNNNILKYFKKNGVSLKQIDNQVIEENNNVVEMQKEKTIQKQKPVKHVKKEKKEIASNDIPDVIKETISQQKYANSIGECEKYFTNLNKTLISSSDVIIGNEHIYEDIFNILSKKYKNNVVLVGKNGVGKTATIRYLAKLIEEKKVPKSFQNKVVLEVSANELFIGTMMRGSFESRMKTILNDARTRDNYIFFIDSIETFLRSNFNNNDIETFVETIMKEKSIMLICTTSESQYTKLFSDNSSWNRHFEKIMLEEPSIENTIEILKHTSERLGYFHNVNYPSETIEACVKLSKKYISNENLPDSAIAILDVAGSRLSIMNDEKELCSELTNKHEDILKEMEEAKKNQDYSKYDELSLEEIRIRSEIEKINKEHKLDEETPDVNIKLIKECISKKTGVNITDLTIDDKEKLKGINERIKEIVIGQDDAVNEVCQAVKRQRIGISNPDKPIIFLFSGPTGTGKTYLAKTIANELFGDEKKLVRFDMAEYADKTSVSKLIGAGSGYVGYENGGLLTEAIKKHKHCVLLLDEIEKADKDVFNTFLSLFDEGHITDNKGVTVNLKNTIIIMTSNIGAKEASEKKKDVGFIMKEENETQRQIYEKEIKKAFKPEFINRIDKIVYFNKLDDETIKHIVSLEIDKLKNRIKEIGYNLSDRDDLMLNLIYEKVKEQKDYGARPILREIQTIIEDKLTDYIIDNCLDNNDNNIIFNDIYE